MSQMLPTRMTIPSTFDSVVGLMRSIALDGDLSLSTIGPEGTSADFVCRTLTHSLSKDVSLKVDFTQSFDAAMTAVLEGRSELALVPSAYRDATAFHWHADLKMTGCFVRHTPAYGLATRDGSPGRDRIVLAAMTEVQDLFAQLAPEGVRDRLDRVITARSTSHAARLVREGQATMAVCNELGIDQNRLRWFRHREGVPMVWMLFARHQKAVTSLAP